MVALAVAEVLWSCPQCKQVALRVDGNTRMLEVTFDRREDRGPSEALPSVAKQILKALAAQINGELLVPGEDSTIADFRVPY